MYFFFALLALPLAILVLWAASLAWLTSISRERRVFGVQFALCGAGFLVGLVLITTSPADDLRADVDDFTPLWGWVLLFSSVVGLLVVCGLWALTALLRHRRQRPHEHPRAEKRRAGRAVRRVVGRHPLAISLAGTIVVFLFVIVPVSQARFGASGPPDSVTAAAAALDTKLQNTPGISSFSVTAQPSGYGDSGSRGSASAWRITATVSAEPGSADIHKIAYALRDGLAAAATVTNSVGLLTVTGDGYADTTFDFDSRETTIPTSELIDAGILLRTVAGTQAVDLSDSAPPRLTVASASRWPATVQALRALAGFGTGATTSVTVNTPGRDEADPGVSSIVVDGAVPDETTLSGLTAIAGQAGVASLVYDAVPPRGSRVGWRPTLDVATTTAGALNDVVQQLSTFDSQATLAASSPRAGYTVYSQSDEVRTDTTGYLGLPPGTTEPNDTVPLPEPSVAPEVHAATCAKNEELVRALLDDSGDIAGIHGTTSLNAPECADGSGTEVVGRVTIPIFEIADTADPAYEAIVASWMSQGYTSEDHAGPLETRTGGALKLLTIRGGPSGITISATSY